MHLRWHVYAGMVEPADLTHCRYFLDQGQWSLCFATPGIHFFLWGQSDKWFCHEGFGTITATKAWLLYMGAVPALASLSGSAPNCCNHACPLFVVPKCDDTSASALNVMGRLAAQWRPRVCAVHHIVMKCNMDVQVKSESKRVWKFIIEREIEAPARFQAIQTHRAVMAILQQQACPFCLVRQGLITKL